MTTKEKLNTRRDELNPWAAEDYYNHWEQAFDTLSPTWLKMYEALGECSWADHDSDAIPEEARIAREALAEADKFLEGE